MHHSSNRGRAAFCVVASCLLVVAAPLAAAEDGTYEGTTSQGKSISITVSGGSITGYTLEWTCGGSTGTTESDQTCAVDAGGSFSCGSDTCTYVPFVPNFLLTGTFSGESVSGDFDMAIYPCLYGCACSYCTAITYTASLPAPQFSIGDVSLPEGDSGTSAAELEVTRSYDDGNTATVDWATSDGTADGSDYTPASGMLTFGPGQLSQTVSIQVSGDTDPEPNEVFYVDLSNPTNAGIADPRGECTIEDDDRQTRSVVLLLDGLQSMDLLADPDNYILTRRLARTPEAVVGVGWDLSLESVGASWLSEFTLYFDGSDRDGSGLHLQPGAGDDFPGAQTYASPVIQLTDVGIAEIPILQDGRLYIELYEGYDDYSNSVDGHYHHPSSLTVEHTVREIFSDGFESGDTSAWSSTHP